MTTMTEEELNKAGKLLGYSGLSRVYSGSVVDIPGVGIGILHPCFGWSCEKCLRRNPKNHRCSCCTVAVENRIAVEPVEDVL